MEKPCGMDDGIVICTNASSERTLDLHGLTIKDSS
jgi:hypothetical protein